MKNLIQEMHKADLKKIKERKNWINAINECQRKADLKRKKEEKNMKNLIRDLHKTDLKRKKEERDMKNFIQELHKADLKRKKEEKDMKNFIRDLHKTDLKRKKEERDMKNFIQEVHKADLKKIKERKNWIRAHNECQLKADLKRKKEVKDMKNLIRDLNKAVLKRRQAEKNLRNLDREFCRGLFERTKKKRNNEKLFDVCKKRAQPKVSTRLSKKHIFNSGSNISENLSVYLGSQKNIVEFGPKNRPTTEVTLENDMLQTATTDLNHPNDVSESANLRFYEKEKERLEDEFQVKIIPAFAKIESFRKFARARNGLCLDEEDIQLIAEEHPHSVESQKIYILKKWREKSGPQATVPKIRSILEEYQKPKPESERLLDTFQDKVAKSFSKMEDFLEFARSKRGLCLEEPDIQHVVEDYPFSVKEQKMQILLKWKELNCNKATVLEIQTLVAKFRNHTQVAQETDNEAIPLSQYLESEQLKSVFEEVTKPYTAIEELGGFATSKSGLGLTDNDFQRITSFEGQKSQLLELWIERQGSDATAQKLRTSAARYKAEKDLIVQPNRLCAIHIHPESSVVMADAVFQK